MCPRCGLVALEKCGLCRDCENAYQREWRRSHPGKASVYHAKWRESNLEYDRERKRAWARENREQRRDKVRANNQKRRARLSGADGHSYTTPDLIAQRVLYHGSRCRYCGSHDDLGIDHMIPLSRGGGHWPSNLVPCCTFCNSSKKDKTYSEFKSRLR